MKNILSEKVSQLQEAATIKMSQLARELTAQGHDVISLSLGEPDFDTPEYIKDAAKKALDDGYTKYTPIPGLLELRKEISKKFRVENDLNYSPQQIVVSSGAKQGLANIAQAILGPGDETILLAPFWVSYKSIVDFTGAKTVLVSAGIEDDFIISPSQLRKAITDKTKLIVFSSPCNPTGSVYSEDELRALAEVLKDFPNILVVADEIYEYINFLDKHFSIGSIEHMQDRTATINGFSKGFSMTGWRLGYMGAPLWLAEACTKIQGQVTSGANAFSQKAAADILMADKSSVEEMKAVFLNRRDMMIGLLREVEGFKVNLPKGAFYILPDISDFFGKSFNGKEIKNAIDFCNFLLNEAHVALVPGGGFGAPNCIRISYAASNEKLREVVKRIKNVVTKLK